VGGQVRRALPWLAGAGPWAQALLHEACADAVGRSLKRRASAACWRAATALAHARGLSVFAGNLAATLLGAVHTPRLP
jgi:hypothetical protein